MLLYIDGEVVEIRPFELFESKNLIQSRYLEILDSQDSEDKKKKE